VGKYADAVRNHPDKKVVVRNLQTFDGNLLFTLAVEAFDENATNPKAVAVWDAFLAEDVYTLGEMSRDSAAGKAALGALKTLIDGYRDAQGAGRATPGIFKDVMDLTKLLEVSFHSALTGALEVKPDSFVGAVFKGWEEKALKVKKILKAADFNMAVLGLTAIADLTQTPPLVRQDAKASLLVKLPPPPVQLKRQNAKLKL
jgi:hypothetical protein